MAESWGKGLKTPVNGSLINLDPYLGIIIFKTKLTHGKPLWSEGFVAYTQYTENCTEKEWRKCKWQLYLSGEDSSYCT